MNNSKFDVRIEIRTRVLPREIPDAEDRLKWEQIERHVDFEAKILGKSLEEYLEYLTKNEYRYRFPEKEKI